MWEAFFNWFSEPDNQIFLAVVIITFTIGVLIGSRRRAGKKESTGSAKIKGDSAFFKGVQYILSNDHDNAIEEFTKSVRVNSDTVETYVALGNLYRSKGDIDRAIRIRQSIILRPKIDKRIKLNALFDLGLDYRKGGFLNRALKTFLKVAQGDPTNIRILKEIEKIYEETKDWEHAYRIGQKISHLKKGDDKHILAHYLVEEGKVSYEKGDTVKAKSLFEKAIATHKECVDAYLHLGDLYFSKKEYKKAVSTWKMVAKVSPQLTFLAYRRLEGSYSKMKDLTLVEDFLKECAQLKPDAFTHMALSRYLFNGGDVDGALREIDRVLELEPAFWKARKFRGEILLNQNREQEALVDYRELIEHLDVPYLEFQCFRCGYRTNELLWQCPQCKRWDTISIIESAGSRSMAHAETEEALTGFRKGEND